MIKKRIAVKSIRTPKRVLWGVVLLLPLLFYFNGCGRKAPPVAPKQPQMPAVSDLSAVYADDRVILQWHHPGGVSPTVGYQVLQYRRPVSEPDCPECPMVFQRVGSETLLSILRTKRHALSRSLPVARGSVYHYKVVPYQSSGAQGPDSNVVQVTVK